MAVEIISWSILHSYVAERKFKQTTLASVVWRATYCAVEPGKM